MFISQKDSDDGNISPSINPSSDNDLLNIPSIIASNSETPADSSSSIPSSSQDVAFQTFIDQGLVRFIKHNSKLTEKGIDLYRAAVKEKYTLKNDIKEREMDDDENHMKKYSIQSIQVENPNDLISGTVTIDEHTEILSPVQSHLVVGQESVDGKAIDVFAFLTSNKGEKTGGGMSTTVSLSKIQPISKEEKGQYAQLIVPPLNVDSSMFEKHEIATQYVNEPEIKSKLKSMQEITDNYRSKKYTGQGITQDDLLTMLEAQEVMQQSVPNIKDNQPAQNKSINSNNNNDEVG